jgi:hypothetical protein
LADLSICVLSLSELIGSNGLINPETMEDIRPLLGPGTLLFCNKLDLLEKGSNVGGIMNQIKSETNCQSCWFGSLADGTGLEGFVDGVSKLLKEK